MSRTPPVRLWRILFGFALILVGPGCMKSQLQFTTRRTSATLPDLQCQQVLDNLARIVSNPGHLPYMAVPGSGVVQVTDTGESALALAFVPHAFTTGDLNIRGARDVSGTWNLGTVTSPDLLKQMQLTYQQAVRRRIAGDPACCWFDIGCKKDVPEDAIYVARCGDVYVWVEPEGVAGLTNLTLAILDIGTREESAPSYMAPSSAPGLVPRRNFQVPAQGPVFTPRAG